MNLTTLPNPSSNQVVLLIDIQEKVFASIEKQSQLLRTLLIFIQACKLLKLPIICSEQYPTGLGSTLLPIKNLLGETYRPWIKTSFSCLRDKHFYQYVLSSSFDEWIIIGLETHICVYQTVEDLLAIGKKVTILNEMVASYCRDDHLQALKALEMQGAHVSCMETFLYKNMQNSGHPQFQRMSQLIKSYRTRA